jgi:hypothetical protein
VSGLGSKRRARLLTASLAALLTGLLAACGVQPTGVIDAGDAPTGVRTFARVYLLREASVQPVLRQFPSETGNIQELVGLLAAGPSQAEEAVGFHTEVPPNLRTVAAPLVSESNITVVAVGPGLDRTGLLAQLQISCTIAGGLTGDLARLRGAIRLSTGVGPVITLGPCPEEIRRVAPVCVPQCITPAVPPQLPPARSPGPSAAGRSRRRRRGGATGAPTVPEKS